MTALSPASRTLPRMNAGEGKLGPRPSQTGEGGRRPEEG
jgi:hypothetical protein